MQHCHRIKLRKLPFLCGVVVVLFVAFAGLRNESRVFSSSFVSKDESKDESKVESKDELCGVLILTPNIPLFLFEESITSSLKHLPEVKMFYVIAANVSHVEEKYSYLGNRVQFVNDNIFPFSAQTIDNYFNGAFLSRHYSERDQLPLLEVFVRDKVDYFHRQLLMYYASRVLHLSKYVHIDADVVFFKQVKFINDSHTNGTVRYNYATPGFHNQVVIRSAVSTGGIKKRSKDDTFRSTLSHHTVFDSKVLEQMMSTMESEYGLSFWRAALNQTLHDYYNCSQTGIGYGLFQLSCSRKITVLSEYDSYVAYAKNNFPQTVAIRPLTWIDGRGNDLFINVTTYSHLKQTWSGYKPVSEVLVRFKDQLKIDSSLGVDFVSYMDTLGRRNLQTYLRYDSSGKVVQKCTLNLLPIESNRSAIDMIYSYTNGNCANGVITNLNRVFDNVVRIDEINPMVQF